MDFDDFQLFMIVFGDAVLWVLEFVMERLWKTILMTASITLVVTGCGSGGSEGSTEDTSVVKNETLTTNSSTHIQEYTEESVETPSLEIPSIDEDQKREFLDAINTARAQAQDCGIYGMMGPSAPLTWNDKLYMAAYEHSYDMANSGNFSHDGSGTEFDNTSVQMELNRGSELDERIEYYGFEWHTVGENIAAGQFVNDHVITAWLESDGHW